MKINEASKMIPNYVLYHEEYQYQFNKQNRNIMNKKNDKQNVNAKPNESVRMQNNKKQMLFYNGDSQEQVDGDNQQNILKQITSNKNKQIKQNVQEKQKNTKLQIKINQKSNMLLNFNLDSDSQRQQQSQISQKYATQIDNQTQKESQRDFYHQNNIFQTLLPTIDNIKYPLHLQPCWNQGLLLSQRLFTQLRSDVQAQCVMRRDKNDPQGLSYSIYLQNNLQHILTVRKQSAWKYGFYQRISSTKNKFEYKKIASLQSNFIGSKYNLKRQGKKGSLATIVYETNILGINGPRRLNIYIPKIPTIKEYLNQQYQTQPQTTIKCVNKIAKWNQQKHSYVLDFKGRIHHSSIKNFVITDQKDNPDLYYIIFGKAAPQIYNLDIQWPFSIIQACAVAITSFQRKINCD